jgi:SAM-dependent methyltransferase
MDRAESIKPFIPRRLRPYLGAARRWIRSIPPRTWLQKQRLLAGPGLSESNRTLLDKVSSRIYHTDGMYYGDGGQYFRVGLSAMHCIDEAVKRAGLQTVRNILDLPCGGGRVLRFFRTRFPQAKLTACDLQKDMVDFCSRQFAASGIYSKESFDEVRFDEPFDLIWSGSLATHLDHRGIRSLLALFERSLAAHGVALITTHGERAIQKLTNHELEYGITDQQMETIVAAFRATGYGFTNYPEVTAYQVSQEAQYGVSLTSPQWMREQFDRAGLREVFFQAHGWNEHQDVYGVVKQA